MADIKIPRVMSTQHPDNVQPPFFAENQDMSGNDEIQEAYYAFSHLGCDEQMWDCEGKEVDDFVVRKLLTRYEHYFRKTVLGEDVRLTLRLPNPDVEKEEAKVLVEALESIPRSSDASKLFYGREEPPIHEVILPMTMSAASLNRVYYYYRDFVVGKQKYPFYPGDISISQWFGEFSPLEISVIPLFEDRENMLESHRIMRDYMKSKNAPYQRVFLARSDPAMNYGMVSAILCNKIALGRLRRLSEETGVPIYPILGAGSPPFRGHLAPDTVELLLREYPEVQTFTVQSAFKYDHPVPQVIDAVRRLSEREMTPVSPVDEEGCIHIIDKVSREYQRLINHLAPIINHVASFVPPRRTRKLHVGLFGYSRSLNEISLPRAISFCAACYSIGLPPEILGLSTLSPDEIIRLKEVHLNFDFDMEASMAFFNEEVLNILPREVSSALKLDWGTKSSDEDHREVTSRFIKALGEGHTPILQPLMLEAAHIRKFLG